MGLRSTELLVRGQRPLRFREVMGQQLPRKADTLLKQILKKTNLMSKLTMYSTYSTIRLPGLGEDPATRFNFYSVTKVTQKQGS